MESKLIYKSYVYNLDSVLHVVLYQWKNKQRETNKQKIPM